MFLYTVNGVMYGTFNEDYSGFVEGTEVEIVFEQRGKYNNIKTMAIKGENKLSSFKPATEITEEIIDRQRLIVRQSCLAQANELMKNFPNVLNKELTPEENLKAIAEMLEKWVFDEHR